MGNEEHEYIKIKRERGFGVNTRLKECQKQEFSKCIDMKM